MKRLSFVAATTLMALLSTPALAWTKQVEVSPIDDSKTVVLIQDASDTYANRYGREGRANIQILCEENRTGLALVLPELYTSDNGSRGTVTFRVDSNPAFDRDMISANDHGSLAVLSGPAISLIKQMIDGEKLVVRFMTVNEPSMIATFPLTGLADGIVEVRETCGW